MTLSGRSKTLIRTRRVARNLTLALLASTFLIGPSSPTASAVGTVTCTSPTTIITTEPSGAMWRYTMTNPTAATAETGSRVAMPYNWKNYGKIVASTNGSVYAISTATADAGKLYYYHWNGSTFDIDHELMGTGWSYWTTSAGHKRITADARGNLFAVDATGTLLRYTWSTSSKSFTVSRKPLATGWDKYDLIFAAGDGIIYARTPAGDLYRFRYDSPADREIIATPATRIGTGFNSFTTGMFSPGGDIFIALNSAGKYQYRYDPDTNTWPILKDPIGATNWSAYNNATAFSNSCTLANSGLAKPFAIPASTNAPVALRLRTTSAGIPQRPVDFGYVDNVGRVIVARQPSRDNPAINTPIVISGDKAYSGRPQLVEENDGKTVNTYALNQTSLIDNFVKPDSTTVFTTKSAGGVMKSPPTAIRLTDTTIALFAVDAAGDLWLRKRVVGSSNSYPWRKLTRPRNPISGPVTLTSLQPGTTAITARTTTGALAQTTITDTGTLQPWTQLAGTGFSGTPAVIVAPGYKMRIVARQGVKILTQSQTTTGGPFPQTWTTVGFGATPSLAGSPSAVFNPGDGRVTIFARSTDGSIYATQETNQACGTFTSWWPTLPAGGTTAYTADPTAYVVDTSGGTQWGIATYDNTFQLTVQYRESSATPVPPTNCVASRAAGEPTHPTFTTQKYPAVP